MDPNAALAEIRRLVAIVRDRHDRDLEPDIITVSDLVEQRAGPGRVAEQGGLPARCMGEGVTEMANGSGRRTSNGSGKRLAPKKPGGKRAR